MPDQFGTIDLPGTSVKAAVLPADILASYSPPPLIKGGTLTSGTNYAAGTVLDYVAGTKKYIASAGTTAVGVLLQGVDATGGDKLGNVIFRGTLKRAKLVGWNATVQTAMGGRTLVRSASSVDDYFIF